MAGTRRANWWRAERIGVADTITKKPTIHESRSQLAQAVEAILRKERYDHIDQGIYRIDNHIDHIICTYLLAVAVGRTDVYYVERHPQGWANEWALGCVNPVS